MALPQSQGRTSLLLVVIIFASGFLLFELFNNQIIEHDSFVEAAETQSTSVVAEQPQRGQILAKDRDGKLYTLAASEERYEVSVAPRLLKNKANMAKLLAAELPELTEAQIYEKINTDKVYLPPLVSGLPPARAETLLKKNYIGVFVRPQLIRVYPEGQAIASQLLGFVGADGQGKYGVESTYDQVLKGTAGSERSKKDSFGRLINVLGVKQPEAGADIILTVDYNLQFAVENKLKEALEKYQAESGSIVVMNPKNGAILAMAGLPNFDPNNYSKVTGDAQRSFLAAAASSQYESGSVMKPLTMAMAIDLNLVQPETTEVFGGSITIGGYEIRNAENKTYGKETMSQVLQNSDNIAMVWVAKKVGKEKQREYLANFGYGQKTGIELVGEQTGSIRDSKIWNDTLSATAAFGQGVSVTPLQLASSYAILANNGKTVSPHLVDQVVKNNQPEQLTFPEGKQVLSEDTAKKIREMLVGVVEFGHGKRAKVEGIRVGGKTGTAEIPDPQGGYYPDRHIGTFAGLFPADDPKFVMVVRLDNPKTVNFAESSAAPTFGEIANWITNYYQLR